MEEIERIAKEQMAKVKAHMKKHYRGTMWDGESFSVTESGRVHMDSNAFIWVDTHIKAIY